MMMRQWILLAEAANDLANRLPPQGVSQYAQALLNAQHTVNPPVWEGGGDLWSFDFRRACKEFEIAWKNGFADLTPSVIVGSLITASQVRQVQERDFNIELVWTGPEVPSSSLRHTEQAVHELINGAKESLLVVSFAVFRIPRICAALERAAARNVKISIIVETPELIDGKGDYDTLQALSDRVKKSCDIFYWPRSKRPADASGRTGLLHIKCITQDGHTAFLTSANLTEYAFTTNMELGTVIRSIPLVSEIEKQISDLIHNGVFEPLSH